MISRKISTIVSSRTSILTVLSILFVTVFNATAFQNSGQPLPSRSSRAAWSQSANRKPSTTQLFMAIPTLDKWKVMPNGSVIGTVKNHPSIADGDVITTSPINNPNAANRMVTVVTASGSKYKLLEPRGGVVINAASTAAQSAAQQREQQSKQQPQAAPAKSSGGGFFGGWGGLGLSSSSSSDDSTTDANGAVNGGSSQSVMDEEEARKRKVRSSPEWSQAVKRYRLTGTTVGLEDEYLLAGKPERSTSGKSNIWEAYKANDMGLPVDNATPVCLKISTNLEAISREYENYRKLSFLGIARTGKFVRCYEFFPVAGYDKRFRNQCALVIERGAQDLKSFLNAKGKLEGKELRDACITATQCVQALHNAGLVWTDMKTENFVVMPNGEVKGIDLESAMPIGDNPVDYSPEACPPEFATAFLAGEGPYFELDTSYDIWSLGMLMLELATGRGYFDGKNPAQITKLLRDMNDGNLDLEGMDCDDRLKDLIGKCLQKDSRKRPNTAQILLHPYFLAGNPFSFLS
ncbi:serine/threonine protein kinase [Nitzschia inconspicua]|uniref:Serine/threonine protein kinase n=1 Tax=Nitzschia inconspicua TaxID=303405 RepID=A0A9K3LYM2_9STRA|nr:serine/threonine protein kinase [Nitzschia inconspicua]